MTRPKAAATAPAPAGPPRKKPGPVPTAERGLVTVRLQVTPAERDRLRVLAALSPHKDMANYCRALVRRDLAARGPEKTARNSKQPN